MARTTGEVWRATSAFFCVPCVPSWQGFLVFRLRFLCLFAANPAPRLFQLNASSFLCVPCVLLRQFNFGCGPVPSGKGRTAKENGAQLCRVKASQGIFSPQSSYRLWVLMFNPLSPSKRVSPRKLVSVHFVASCAAISSSSVPARSN